MSARRAALLLLVALLLVTGVLLLLRTRAESGAPGLERPPAPADRPQATSRLQLPSGEERTSAAEPVAPPVAASEPLEELREEGLRRGYQLPIGKGWWMDALINPTGADPQGRDLALLQERARTLAEQLQALQHSRKQRLDVYCNERIAAGLAFPDPQGVETLPEGKEHVIVTTHSPEAPSRFWRVDVGPGDDAELDRLDRQLASAWCEAVLDLRRRLAASRR